MSLAIDHSQTYVLAVHAAGDGAIDIEPMEPRFWFRALRTLAERVAGASSGQGEPLLRHAYHLLQLTPRPLRSAIRPDLAEAEFEQLLDCGALESAAVGLVGDPMIYSIVRLQARSIEAQVALPGQLKRTRARGASVPLAMLAAWAQCLASLETASASSRLAVVES